MSKSILIIDDDAELRKSLRAGLLRDGFDAIQADSAASAAEILRRVSVDGIILDRMMPETDGLSFLRALRKSGIDTPVIMLTAMDGGDNAACGLEGGADDYLAKPFQFRELVLRIRNMIRKSGARDGVSDGVLDGVLDARAAARANLVRTGGEFLARGRPLLLSAREKAALTEMLDGKIAEIPPMTAKRLREKLALAKLENIDIITERGRGYKIIPVK